MTNEPNGIGLANIQLSFMEKMPLTHESFVVNGRVQP